jgi:glycosyltransferase involved in cell wall biosynthesis
MLLNPKISIITCTNNSEQYLSAMLNSVQQQAYRQIEHIFVDNCSTDQTLAMIDNYHTDNPDISVVIISEPDLGIYDALNKGMTVATGDVIGILHSDDVFSDQDCLVRIAKSFMSDAKLDFYCSRMAIYNQDLTQQFAVLGAAPHQQTLREKLYSSTYYAHPTYYCRREIITRVGKYDLQYTLAADIDWLMRLEHLHLNYYFDDRPLIKFRAVGSSAQRYFTALAEEFLIRIKYEGLSVNLLVLYGYHFVRRVLRFLLAWCGLNNLIVYARHLLWRLAKKNN